MAGSAMNERMAKDERFEVFGIAAADDAGNGIALGQAGGEDLLFPLVESGVGEGEFAQAIAPVRIHPRIVQD